MPCPLYNLSGPKVLFLDLIKEHSYEDIRYGTESLKWTILSSPITTTESSEITSTEGGLGQGSAEGTKTLFYCEIVI